MADLDTELSNRLSRLAAAVPVATGKLDPVHQGAVAARQRVRMAWLTPLIVIAFVALLTAAVGGGPLKPSPSPGLGASESPNASSGAQVVTNRDGDFELTLRSNKARYATNEPIEISATLAYLGDRPSVEFTHDSAGAIQFGIREKVFGEITVGGVGLLMCDRTVIERDRPFATAFWKGGGFSGDGSNAEALKAWMQDPVLRLPRGTWHISASAHAPCMSEAPSFSLHAEIVILVDDDPAAELSDATPVPDRGAPVYGGADIGLMALQLKSERPQYNDGAAIELSVWYWFMDGPDIIASYSPPEVRLSIEQLDAKDPQARTVLFDAACVDLGRVNSVERHVPIGPGLIADFRADKLPSSFDDLFVDGDLRLPVGHWRIWAAAAGTFGTCAAPGDPYAPHTSIEIDVVGLDEADINLATGLLARRADGSTVCLTAVGGGVLSVNPRTGLGFVHQPSGTVTDVIWPDGYTARFQDGVAILIDDSGHIVAREGDEMSLGGGYTSDEVFHVCSAGIEG